MVFKISGDFLKLPHLPPIQVLAVNVESNGFYRVQYSKRTLDPIADQLLANYSSISVRTRARIIDDTFTLADFA